MAGSNAFCGPWKNNNGSEDETDIRPRHAVVFPGFAGAGKSVSSSDPLSFFPDHRIRQNQKYAYQFNSGHLY